MLVVRERVRERVRVRLECLCTIGLHMRMRTNGRTDSGTSHGIRAISRHIVVVFVAVA